MGKATTAESAHGEESLSDRLANDLQAIVGEAGSLLKATAEAGDAGTTELRNKIQESLDRATQNLEELRGAAVKQARAAGQATDEFVHDKPWQAIGAAAMVGLIAGQLVARRLGV